MEIEDNIKFCRYCGSAVVAPSTPKIKSVPIQQTYARSQYAPTSRPVMPQPSAPPAHSPTGKSRIVAGIIALLFCGFGIHKFYLEKPENGLIYLCFFWTGIPEIIGIIEGIMYLTESDAAFEERVIHL